MMAREIASVDSPRMEPGGSEMHRLRGLVPPGLWDRSDPFLLLAEDWYTPGVFDNHPHRGFETVTYVVDGSVSHYDNRGNKGIIGAGEALWLTSGRGIVHNEVPIEGKPAHVLQLWINLPRAHKLVDARYQELKVTNVPKRRPPGAEVIVFSGASGDVVAPTRNYASITMVEARLQPASSFEQELPEDYNGFVVVLEGDGTIGSNATPVRAGQVAWLKHESEASKVSFSSNENGLRLILFAGKPLREPVVARGPFVMNTAEEVQEAYSQFRREQERFGLEPLPAHSTLNPIPPG